MRWREEEKEEREKEGEVKLNDSHLLLHLLLHLLHYLFFFVGEVIWGMFSLLFLSPSPLLSSPPPPSPFSFPFPFGEFMTFVIETSPPFRLSLSLHLLFFVAKRGRRRWDIFFVDRSIYRYILYLYIHSSTSTTSISTSIHLRVDLGLVHLRPLPPPPLLLRKRSLPFAMSENQTMRFAEILSRE